MGHSKNIFMEERLVSNCCNAEDRTMMWGGPSYSTAQMCPKCREHCDFISESHREEEMKVEILTGKKDTNE
jgi:hypothetical protein